MQSPIATAKIDGKTRLTYPIFGTFTPPITYQTATTNVPAILDDVQIGDAELAIPSQFSNAKLSSIEFKIKSQLLADVGGIVRPLYVEPAAIGSLPGIAGRGININGVLSNYTFVGESGRLDLSFCPSVIDLSDMYGVFTIPSSYNSTTWPAAAGSTAFFKVYIAIIIIVYE